MLSAHRLSRLQHLSCLPGLESQAPGPAWQDPVFLGQTHRGRTLCGGDSHQSVALNFFARLNAFALSCPHSRTVLRSLRPCCVRPAPADHFSTLIMVCEPASSPDNAETESDTPVSAYSCPLPFTGCGIAEWCRTRYTNLGSMGTPTTG